MNQVLQFPKEKTKRVQQSKKAEGQRFFLTLSVFSFILVAVLSNEQVMRNQRPMYLISDNSSQSMEQVNRAIASAQPLNMFRDVEWEHQLAAKFADRDDRKPASYPQKLTLLDQLRYGDLAGKYRIHSIGSEASPQDMHVEEIEYADSNDSTEHPVRIHNPQDFLLQYRKLMPVDFNHAEMAKNDDGGQTWSLVSNEGNVVGHVVLHFDSDQRLLKMQVQGLDRVSTQ